MNSISGPPSERAFLNWVVTSRKREIGIVVGSVYVIVTVLITRFAQLQPGALDRFLKTILENGKAPYWLPSLVQCVALLPLLVACAVIKLPDWVMEKYSLAIDACNQFRDALTFLISTWVVFYFLLFLQQINIIGIRWDPWIDLLNNLQGVFLFVAYWILTAKTLVSKESREKQGPNGYTRPLWSIYSVLLWVVLLFLIADLSASPKAEGTFPIRMLFQLLSGLWVGVSLALLIGCLEGQYLGQPRKVTLFLYLYAALQLAYVGFNQAHGLSPAASVDSSTYFLQEFATVTSLPLKLLFIGFWYWVLQNGLLAFYMKKTREDIDVVPGEWSVFSNHAESGQQLSATSSGLGQT
jgi:hypothetical protein